MKALPRTLAASCIVLWGASALAENMNNYTFAPKKGFVPTPEVALKIAVAVLEPVYGKNAIKKEMPLNVALIENVWRISGTPKSGYLGGVMSVDIDKTTGEVKCMSHGK